MLIKALRLPAAAVLCISLSGCATSSKLLRLAGLRPAEHADIRAASFGFEATPTPSPTDRLFAGAHAAIEARDYGKALDLLQIAKQRSPDDVRVLNALGVVYDKLGRFDLSDRYYRGAALADPQSAIVASNIEYSALLRRESQSLAGQAAAPAHDLAAASPPPAAPQLTLGRAFVTPQRVGPLFAGGFLAVVNASGRAAGQEPVRRYLASAGWSVRSRLEIRPLQATSQLRFAEQQRELAEALARTLPFQVVMASCSGACAGMELIVGANGRLPYAKWGVS